MRQVLKGTALFLSGFALLVLAGCSEQSSDTSEEQISDESALVELVRADLDAEETDFWTNESGNGGPIMGGSLDEPIDPLNWHRVGRRETASFRVEFHGDSAATIIRHRTFGGELRLLTEISDSGRTVIAKPMHNVLIRRAHAMRVGRDRNPRVNWRIVEITPEVLESAAPNPHTIWPLRVQMFRNGENGRELLADITEPLRYYVNRENLLRVFPEEEIVVFATANTTDAAASFLHPHTYRQGNRDRQPLHDDGAAPDEIAGDGIYSGSYSAPALLGTFHAAVDFMDYESLYDSEGAYDAGGWAIPYRVVAE